MIGVCDSTQKVHNFVGQNTNDKNAWAYYPATNPCTYHVGRNSAKYGKKAVAGDVIGVQVDLEAGTLSFSHNGVDLGVCYSKVNPSHKLFVAGICTPDYVKPIFLVSLFDAGDAVRLQPSITKPTVSDISGLRVAATSPLYYQGPPGLVLSLSPFTTVSSIESLLNQLEPGLNYTFKRGMSGRLHSTHIAVAGNPTLEELIAEQKPNNNTITLLIGCSPSSGEPAPIVDLAHSTSGVLSTFIQAGGLPLLAHSLLKTLRSADGKSKASSVKAWESWLTVLTGMLQLKEFQVRLLLQQILKKKGKIRL